MLSEFELGYNFTKATKNICCAKSEEAVDHSVVTRWFKKFYLGCKNLDIHVGLIDATEANLASSNERVSGKLGISQFTVLSPSRPQQKHLERSNFASRY